jgi:GAF domain-containing protein
LLFTDISERHRAIDVVPGAPGQDRIRSFLGLPLTTRQGLVGVWVLVADRPGAFDAEHLDLLMVVAAQAATMISNAMLHQTVELLSVTDGLTGLYNHRRFQERLQHEIDRGGRTGEPVSLLLLDIDHFKRINDAHGHPFALRGGGVRDRPRRHGPPRLPLVRATRAQGRASAAHTARRGRFQVHAEHRRRHLSGRRGDARGAGPPRRRGALCAAGDPEKAASR